MQNQNLKTKVKAKSKKGSQTKKKIQGP
jgi:hypothetical protein